MNIRAAFIFMRAYDDGGAEAASCASNPSLRSVRDVRCERRRRSRSRSHMQGVEGIVFSEPLVCVGMFSGVVAHARGVSTCSGAAEYLFNLCPGSNTGIVRALSL